MPAFSLFRNTLAMMGRSDGVCASRSTIEASVTTCSSVSSWPSSCTLSATFVWNPCNSVATTSSGAAPRWNSYFAGNTNPSRLVATTCCRNGSLYRDFTSASRNACFVTTPAFSRISPTSSTRRPSGMTASLDAVFPSAIRCTTSITGVPRSNSYSPACSEFVTPDSPTMISNRRLLRMTPFCSNAAPIVFALSPDFTVTTTGGPLAAIGSMRRSDSSVNTEPGVCVMNHASPTVSAAANRTTAAATARYNYHRPTADGAAPPASMYACKITAAAASSIRRLPLRCDARPRTVIASARASSARTEEKRSS